MCDVHKRYNGKVVTSPIEKEGMEVERLKTTKFQETLVLKENEKCDCTNKIWERVKEGFLKAATEVCGWIKGQLRHTRYKTGWWDEGIVKRVGEKNPKIKAWCHAKDTTVAEELFKRSCGREPKLLSSLKEQFTLR